MRIKSPSTPEEWEKYFHLRWEILRAPWQQPKGSEKDEAEFDADSYHAMAVDSTNKVIGVGRLSLLKENKAQIRFMAIKDDQQGKGVGSMLLAYLENIAKTKDVNFIFLQAREHAIVFYEKHNYCLKEKTFLLYGQIRHFLMEKSI